MAIRIVLCWLGLVIFSAGICLADEAWRPAAGILMTKWAQTVTPERVLPEYPRPLMVRAEWDNLNGLWDYAIAGKQQAAPQKYAGRILVPFAVESALSGVMKRMGVEERLWYRRTFELKAGWRGKRVLLHFGAVDWETKVFVNGREVGRHRGGYDPFCFDITDALREETAQEIVVSVWDPTNAGCQARGKQVAEPKNIWYTPTTGIWQTVWLEAVESAHIKKLWITPDVDAGLVRIKVDTVGTKTGDRFELKVFAEGKEIVRQTAAVGEELAAALGQVRLWSPEKPFLYDIEVKLQHGGTTTDKVDSYFGMRKIEVGPGPDGVTRLLLNGKAVFQVGPLDQGFWPDGLYTAPTDEALRYDIEMTKKLGFNMARKHVKVEPARWYYWCDKLGLLVWQDMPSGNHGKKKADKVQFERELEAMVRNFYNHPSIVMWVVFNETWGQYDTERLAAWVKQADPTRLVNSISGWFDKGVGDVHDVHVYPGPAIAALEQKRAVVLGEFGGLGLKVSGHMWDKRGWGYQEMEGRDDLLKRYRNLWQKTWQLKCQAGLSAAVYTQTTDVETETNGLMTYDRAVCKMAVEPAAQAAQGYLPPVLASAEQIFIESANVALTSPNGKGEVRYTLDGSEPTAASRKYDRPIHLSETTTIKARCFWTGNRQSETSEFKIRRVKPYEAVAASPSGATAASFKPGLEYRYYEAGKAKWAKLPDLSALVPQVTGQTDLLDLSRARRGDYFALAFEGLIDVPRDGVYTFYVTSDDGARLYLHGEKIVNNAGRYGPLEEVGRVALKAGLHPLTAWYCQVSGERVFSVSWSGPGLAQERIGAGRMYRQDKDK